jgi:hypothetical protein
MAAQPIAAGTNTQVDITPPRIGSAVDMVPKENGEPPLHDVGTVEDSSSRFTEAQNDVANSSQNGHAAEFPVFDREPVPRVLDRFEEDAATLNPPQLLDTLEEDVHPKDRALKSSKQRHTDNHKRRKSHIASSKGI